MMCCVAVVARRNEDLMFLLAVLPRGGGDIVGGSFSQEMKCSCCGRPSKDE